MIHRRALLTAAAASALPAFTPARKQLLLSPASRLPPGLSLDLSFLTPGTLDPRITFTRASTATYFDSTGTLQTAATNAPRWDYNPSTRALQGLLIEEARTNLLLWSTDFTNAAWALFNGATKGATIVGPGGTTGMTVNFSSTYPSQFYQSISGYPAGTTFSVWARANTLSSFQLRFSVDGNSPTLTLTSQWQRFSFVTTGATNTNLAIQNAAALAGSIDIAMPQLEAGAFATSYIPTTAASVTRAADFMTMATAPWYVATAGSVAAYVINNGWPPAGVNRNACVWSLDDGAGTRANSIDEFGFINGGANFAPALNVFVASVNKGNPPGANPTVAPSSVIGVGGAWAGATISIAVNGQVGSGALTGLPSGVSRLSMGFGYGGAGTLNGYLRRVRYWPRVLTNAELQSVTT